MKTTNIELEDLTGNHVLSGIETGETTLYVGGGCCAATEYVKFTLDGVTYLAVENPDDVYRSYMEDLMICETPCKISLPDIDVVCHMRDAGKYGDDVLVFVDAKNGKTILELGTADYGDYYHYCVMAYTPENMSCNAGVAEVGNG